MKAAPNRDPNRDRDEFPGGRTETRPGPDSDPGPSFRDRVVSVVGRIPPGRVATYGDVATWAGAPRAARAVGAIMATMAGESAPCHRVIAAGGRLGGYGGQDALKRALLRAEGVRVEGRRIVGFPTVRWAGPPRSRPSTTPSNSPKRATRRRSG